MFHIVFHIFLLIVLAAAWHIESKRLRTRQISDDSLIALIGILIVGNVFDLGVSLWRVIA